MNDIEFKQIVRQSVEKNETLNVAFTLDPRYNSVLAEITQKSVAAQEPTVTQTAVMEPQQTQLENAAKHLTEKEATEIVQRWVTQDDEVEISERRTFEEMVEELGTIKAVRPPISDISASRLREIVQKYAPNAPKSVEHTQQSKLKTPPYPPELASLIQSGVAVYESNHWFVKHCTKCGNYRTECCGSIELASAVNDGIELATHGRRAAGLDPIKVPKPPLSTEEIAKIRIEDATQQTWWSSFRGAGELQGNGKLKMFIENVIPEGITLICGLPKEGKSFLALSITKALTTGKPLFGQKGYEVPEIVPVLYLAAESGDGALKLRCNKFGITTDKTKFLARTLSQGLMFTLADPEIEQAVKLLHPVIILETLIRFNDGKNEDDATENRKLAEALFRLISWGARAVIAIHHSRKDLNKTNPTKESAVRGSGDGLAMVDVVWLVMQDDKLHQKGRGPTEIDVVGWGRDFSPVPMRLALTRKAVNLPPGAVTHSPGIVSVIDTEGDLGWVQKGIVFGQGAESTDQAIERLVIEDPSISKKMLAERTEMSEWEVRNALKRLGYHREKGGKKGASPWIKGQS